MKKVLVFLFLGIIALLVLPNDINARGVDPVSVAQIEGSVKTESYEKIDLYDTKLVLVYKNSTRVDVYQYTDEYSLIRSFKYRIKKDTILDVYDLYTAEGFDKHGTSQVIEEPPGGGGSWSDTLTKAYDLTDVMMGYYVDTYSVYFSDLTSVYQYASAVRDSSSEIMTATGISIAIGAVGTIVNPYVAGMLSVISGAYFGLSSYAKTVFAEDLEDFAESNQGHARAVIRTGTMRSGGINYPFEFHDAYSWNGYTMYYDESWGDLVGTEYN